MSDEDFSSYKDELVAIREAIVAELKLSENDDADNDDDNENADDKNTNSNEGNEDNNNDEDDEIAAADSNASINMMQSVAAALNMEVMPNESMITKYVELGNQMAENIKGKKNKSNK
jgi:hypothetical protein